MVKSIFTLKCIEFSLTMLSPGLFLTPDRRVFIYLLVLMNITLLLKHHVPYPSVTCPVYSCDRTVPSMSIP